MGYRMVSARRPKVVGTELLKLADWYIRDSLEEAHCLYSGVSKSLMTSHVSRAFVNRIFQNLHVSTQGFE